MTKKNISHLKKVKIKDILTQNKNTNYNILCFGIDRFNLITDIYGKETFKTILEALFNVLTLFYGNENIYKRPEQHYCYVLEPRKKRHINKDFELLFNTFKNVYKDISININCGIYEILDISLSEEIIYDRTLIASNNQRLYSHDNYFLYYDDLKKKLDNEFLVRDGLQKAIDEEQFVVYFQPKYDLESEKIAGAEALVRWIHPSKGLILPGKFIPIFEKNGLVTKIDIFVWEKTCQYLKLWMDNSNNLIPISVNVSRAHFKNRDIINTLCNLIKKYNIPVNLLHLEITESLCSENSLLLIEIVEELRKKGFVVEMDDFGSGYSSLNMLAEMPVDILKLDMKLIQAESKSKYAKDIIRFIIDLAKVMNLLVVAEGVETVEQIDMLKTMKCNYVQGYYYAKSMNYIDFTNLLKIS